MSNTKPRAARKGNPGPKPELLEERHNRLVMAVNEAFLAAVSAGNQKAPSYRETCERIVELLGPFVTIGYADKKIGK